MKKWLLFSLVVFSLSSCNSCDEEKEDFGPYPGGKIFKELPKT